MLAMPVIFNYLRLESISFDAGHRDDYSQLARPYYGITYIRSGHALYRTGTETFCLEAGDILLTPLGSTYISEWSSDSKVCMDAILFNMECDLCASRSPGVRRKYPVQAVRGLEHLGDKIRKMIEIYNDFHANMPPYETFDWYSEVYAIIGAVWQKVVYEEVPAPDPRLLPALDYIEANLFGTVTVEALAKLCFMSSSHFHACFAKEMGLPPIRYKLKRQIEQAQLMLLVDIEKPVCDIAHALGFESLSYFYRVFTGITGISPGKYRGVFGSTRE